MSNFVVFEGGDGSGTTTQLSILRRRWATDPPLWATAEPTNGPIGRLIRQVLRKADHICPQTMAHLFAADRAEHLFAARGIVERCRQGTVVVCDRYVPSSLAYQGIECSTELIERLNADFPLPELLVFFDIEPDCALKRIKGRPVQELYEEAAIQEKVCNRYRELLPVYRGLGSTVEVIDAHGSQDEIAEALWAVMQKLPIMGKVRNYETLDL
ncbi:MAG: dTMP kinase [Spirochaetaceae bacterium]|nr:dTMP kinase [Spirochaetaceae bacterium]